MQATQLQQQPQQQLLQPQPPPPSPPPPQPPPAPGQHPPSSLPPQPQASSSARLSAESVQIIAQSLSHLPTLTDGAAASLALDAEYRLRQIVQDAVKFMKHAKRARLQPHDVNAALRLRNAEPIHGFGAAASTRDLRLQQQLQTKKLQQLRGRPPTVAPPPPPGVSRGPASGPGSTATAPPPSVLSPRSGVQLQRQAAFLAVPGVPKLFFEVDLELNVRAAAEAPLPPVPLEVTVCPHWLVIDSVQPRISQNPLRLNGPLEQSGTKSGGTQDPSAAPNGTGHASSGPSSSDPAPTSVQALAKRTVIKPIVKHVLSRELQLYYESLTSLLYGNDVSRVQSCLASVADEPGIVQLLPYLSLFISNAVPEHTRNLPFLLSLVRLFSAILDNRAFPLERYLHQTLPGMITCLVGKRLCVDTKHNHWGLRDYTASVLRRVCARFSRSYTNLQGRITRTLTDAIDSGRRPLTTHYGAIVGLAALGPVVVDELLRPRLADYAKKVAAVIQNSKAKPIRRYEARKVFAALAWAVSIGHDVEYGATNGSIVTPNRKEPETRLFPLDSVRVVPEEVDLILPQFSRLLPDLEKDLGKRLYPFRESLSPCELAEKIAAEGGYKAVNS